MLKYLRRRVLQPTQRLPGCIALLIVVAACSIDPATTAAPIPARIEVIETRIEPPIGSDPVIGVRIRAPQIVGDYGFSWSATVDAMPPSTSFGPACRPQELSGSVDLLRAQAGTIFPAFAAAGQTMDATGAIHDGWLTVRLADKLMNFGLEGCELAFGVTAGYTLIEGGDFEPAPKPPPPPSLIATVRVRGDGTALTATPRPVVTASPTISPIALEAEALTAYLLPILSDWNAVAEPVSIGLMATTDLVRWARETKTDRNELGRIYDRMAKVIERITVSELVYPFGDLVVNYARKLDGIEGVAAGALEGDPYRTRVGYAALERAVQQAPDVLQRWVTAILPYLTDERAERLRAIVDAEQ